MSLSGPVSVATNPPGCYNRAKDDTTDWPYFLDNNIQSAPFFAPVPEVGFDVAANTVKLPGSVFELMSYCHPCWISPHTYLGMLGVLDSPTPEPLGGFGNFSLVSGTLEEDGGVSFLPLFTLETKGFMDSTRLSLVGLRPRTPTLFHRECRSPEWWPALTLESLSRLWPTRIIGLRMAGSTSTGLNVSSPLMNCELS